MQTAPKYAPSERAVRPVIGWAVVADQKIKIRTVSDTRRAAIVNFLVTDRSCFIHGHMTDEEIERLWLQQRQGADVEFVTISLGAVQ